MGVFRGGTGGPDPPRIARLLLFAMLKFSVRPIWEFGPPWENFLDLRMFYVKNIDQKAELHTKEVFLLNPLSMQLLYIMLCLSCYMLYVQN